MPQGRVPHQRPLCLPGQGEPLPHHGPGQWRRPALSSHQKHQIQLRANHSSRVGSSWAWSFCITRAQSIATSSHRTQSSIRRAIPESLIWAWLEFGSRRTPMTRQAHPGIWHPRSCAGAITGWQPITMLSVSSYSSASLGANRQEIRDKILAKQAQIKKKDIPSDWSTDAIDFVNQLIQRKPQNRLGNNGPEEVMAHPWFKDVDWNRLRRKQVVPPFSPVYNSEEYQQQLNNVSEVPIPAETILLLKKDTIQNLFLEYIYDGKTVQNPLLQI